MIYLLLMHLMASGTSKFENKVNLGVLECFVGGDS